MMTNQKKYMIAAGVGALSFSAWVGVRLRERAKFKKMLDDSASVTMAKVPGVLLAKGISLDKLVTWKNKDKAAELISIFDVKTADQAMAEVLMSLPVPPETWASEAKLLSDDAKEQIYDWSATVYNKIKSYWS